MGKRIILIVGVSGVGKSTLCKSITEKYPQSLHLTASKFAKKNDEIDYNQTNLTRRIRASIESFDGSLVLIDGHLTFDKFEIPVKAVQLLQLDSILVLEEDPLTILERRKSDLSRLRVKETESTILKAQNREIQYSQSVACSLNINIQIIKQPTVCKVISQLSLI